MARLIRFGVEARQFAEALGLVWPAIESAFLCSDYPPPLNTLISGCPRPSLGYQTRENRASGQTVISIKSKSFQIRSPLTGNRSSTTVSLAFPWTDRLNGIIFVPLIYALDHGPSVFYAVTCGLTGRIVHLFIPALDVAFYELNEARAKIIDAELEANLRLLESEREIKEGNQGQEIAGVIDMVRNYGHHMINHLSGIDVLIREGCQPLVNEYWVYGREFFGPLEQLYPELLGKVRYFSSRASLSAHVLNTRALAIRVGFNSFLKETRARIVSAAQRKYPVRQIKGHFPIVAFTVRTGNRRCVNLPEVIKEIYEQLRPIYPTIGFLVDGWVFSEDEIVYRSNAATCLDPKFINRMREEFSACRDALNTIPAEAVLCNVIGRSVLESVSALLSSHFYFSHVGTLQHKVAFFSLAAGLIHGPQTHLDIIDSGAFQAELGCAPRYLNPSEVGDIATPSERGPSVNDYEIVNPRACGAAFKDLVSAGTEICEAAFP